MKQRLYHIIAAGSVALLSGVLPPSCIYDDEDAPNQQSGTIRVNTLAVDGTRAASDAGGDDTFMVLFWRNKDHLESPGNSADASWTTPYLASRAPQPVNFYGQSVYDTRYPYPDESSPLYATGYAPGKVLTPDKVKGYRRLTATVGDLEKGRYEFLGCDVWSDVYKGSRSDPFAQEKNKLYFRHLAAKLLFYADRDKETMENKQFVRHVEITDLQMSIDDGGTWTEMYTPNVFEWKEFNDPQADFTSSYKKTLEAAKLINSVASDPIAGYMAAGAETFAGEGNQNFKLTRNTSDRVPIAGMDIDSVFVCNPIRDDGTFMTSRPIRLRMDISAEMSFNPFFPEGDGSGSTTDDLTFTRTWEKVELDAIYEIKKGADGTITEDKSSPVMLFKPGNEYRIYIHFFRTGVNLTALELPWNYDSVNYITISGGNKTDTNEKNQ